MLLHHLLQSNGSWMILGITPVIHITPVIGRSLPLLLEIYTLGDL